MTIPLTFPLGDELRTRPPPKEVFHYTSTAGSQGILSSRVLWATDLHYLNDVNEFQHALTLARGQLYPRTIKMPKGNPLKTFIDSLDRGLDRIRRHDIFVFSVSEQCDQLSQWRGYCPPSGGISLGFDSLALKAVANSFGFEFGPCTYDIQEQEALVEEIVSPVIALYDQPVLGADPPEKKAERVLPALLRHLARLAPFLKHPAFAEEKEWRLVSDNIPLTSPEVKYRSSRTTLIPYVAVPLASGIQPFGRIIVGPSDHQDLALRAVSGLGSSCGIQPGNVVGSAVPYRSL